MGPAQEPHPRQAVALVASLSRPGDLASRKAGWGLTLTRWASDRLHKFWSREVHQSRFRDCFLQGLWPASAWAFADLIGILELVGGGMLLIGLGTRVAA